MKNALISALCAVTLLSNCGDNPAPSAEKNFTDTFKNGFLASCQTQASVGMKAPEAKRYCQCALEQVMANWDNDEEAGEALDGMPMLEVQRLLVTPCMGK